MNDPSTAFAVEVRYCIPDADKEHLPRRRRHPEIIPPGAPLPRQGDVIYLSSSSAWGVSAIIYEWRSPRDLLVQLWLEHLGNSRAARAPGFTLTQ